MTVIVIIITITPFPKSWDALSWNVMSAFCYLNTACVYLQTILMAISWKRH